LCCYNEASGSIRASVSRILSTETGSFSKAMLSLERGTDPHPELKRDIPMGVGAAVAARLGLKADGVCFLHQLFDAEFVAVETGLTFNCGEFAGIKTGIVDAFPDAEKLLGVAIAKPVRDKEIPVLGLQHVGQGDGILPFAVNDGDFLFHAVLIPRSGFRGLPSCQWRLRSAGIGGADGPNFSISARHGYQGTVCPPVGIELWVTLRERFESDRGVAQRRAAGVQQVGERHCVGSGFHH